MYLVVYFSFLEILFIFKYLESTFFAGVTERTKVENEKSDCVRSHELKKIPPPVILQNIISLNIFSI